MLKKFSSVMLLFSSQFTEITEMYALSQILFSTYEKKNQTYSIFVDLPKSIDGHTRTLKRNIFLWLEKCVILAFITFYLLEITEETADISAVISPQVWISLLAGNCGAVCFVLS